MSFANFGLSPAMMRAVESLGYENPTPIQAETFPIAISGRDLVGLAETGSGKTASYLLPVVQRLEGGKGLRALVVVPTRELALQVEQVARQICKPAGMRALAVIGGVGVAAQAYELKKGVDVLIATPGRLLDHMRSGNVWLDKVSELILDEADRLLDMGFLPDIRQILRSLPRERHSMLFSATLSNEIEGLVYEFLNKPQTVEIGRRAKPVDTVEQIAYSVMAHHKLPLLLRLAGEHLDGQALIFTRTKRGADKIARVLHSHDHNVAVMHADRSQQQRVAALERFRTGKVKILVATDIAARGIDVKDIAFVVNYDIPATPEDYVHRIGRTARAGREGTAVTFVAPEEEITLRDIMRTTGQPIERKTMENFSDGRTADEMRALAAVVGVSAAVSAGATAARSPMRSARPRRRR
jgi:ATP-dependent RNA helicase RhlE